MPYLVPSLLAESTFTVSSQESLPQSARQRIHRKYLLQLLAMSFGGSEVGVCPSHKFVKNDDLNQVLHLENILARYDVFFNDFLFPKLELLPFLHLLLRHLPLDLVQFLVEFLYALRLFIIILISTKSPEIPYLGDLATQVDILLDMIRNHVVPRDVSAR